MTSYTPNLKLNVPEFDQVPWDVEVNTNWVVLDATVGMFTAIPNLTGVWKNSTDYVYGQSAIDTLDSSIWQCVQTSKSSDPPTTFSQERVLYPARWGATQPGAQFYAQQASDAATAAAASAKAASDAATAIGAALPIAGGTMTGPLILSGDPTLVLGAVTKQYVDARVGGTGYLPITGGTLTGPLSVGGNGVTYMNITAADRHAVGFGWSGAVLYATVDGVGVGSVATQAYVNSGYLPISGGTVTGSLTVNGESRTAAIFRITNSGAYFYSTADYTYLNMDSGGWHLRYDRASGALHYFRSDGIDLWRSDGAGNFGVAGLLNVGGYVAASGNGYFRGGTVWWGAGDRSYLQSDNGTYTAVHFLDNYQWNLNWSTGTIAWHRYDSTALFSVDVSGNGNFVGALNTAGNLGVRNGQMFFGDGGAGRIMVFAPGWYWSWNINNGVLVWTSGNSNFWVLDITTNIAFNDRGPVAGRGAYQDWSDVRFKRDIAPATVGLSEILGLKPISFIRIFEGRENEQTEIGFSAQDVQSVIPLAVHEAGMEGDKTLAISTTPIVAALVNGMKELAARISALENGA